MLIELWGGPRDGERFEMDNPGSVLFAHGVPPMSSEELIAMQVIEGVPESIPLVELAWADTKRVNKAGAHVYRYVGERAKL